MMQTSGRNAGLALLPLPILVAFILLSKADQTLFGVSSDFWAGLFLCLGLVTVIAALSSAYGRKPAMTAFREDENQLF